MKISNEQRESRRKAIQMPLTFEISEFVTGFFSNAHIPCTGLDISSGGIGISSNHRLQKSAIVKVGFSIEKDINLQLFGEVVWVRTADGECRAGLQFLG